MPDVMPPFRREDYLTSAISTKKPVTGYETDHVQYNYKEADFPKLYNALLNINWNFFDSASRLNNKKPNLRTNPPWFNGHITHDSSKRKSSKNLQIRLFRRSKFKNLRYQIKQDISIPHSSYLRSIENNIRNDPKQF